MLLIYSEEISPRLEYIAKLIFEDILNIKITFTTNSSEFKKSELPKINYSFEKFGDELYIKASRLLYCRVVIYPDFGNVRYKGEKYFFETSKDSVLPFDPFAAAFFVVTRQEEYLEKRKGKYKRYNSRWSILSKNMLLEKPVVNIWANLLAQEITKKHPSFIFPERKFEFQMSIDIDNAWAIKNKALWRHAASGLENLIKGKQKLNKEKIDVLLKSKKDPYDTYEYLDHIFKGKEDKVLFFFLLGDYAKYDKNISHRNKELRKLIKQTHKKYKVGIHPSYGSSKKGNSLKIAKEKTRLERIIGEKVIRSRQHYLRLKFPTTYRRLIKHGIKEDYTMGYANRIGFRAGICSPFYFYDLKKEKATSLRIHPFQVMDVTLKDYMGLTPEKSKEAIKKLMLEVKKVGGTFTALWHNETLGEDKRWKGFREVFEFMNELGAKLENE